MAHVESEPEPGTRRGKSLSEVVDAIADASWDMFVMPGEHANSRYDRPLEPLEAKAEETAEEPEAAFNWGGGQNEEALRLPTGVGAAERLSVPVARPRSLWFEREGRDVKGDIEMLSREWTRLWAVVVVIALAVVAADSLHTS